MNMWQIIMYTTLALTGVSLLYLWNRTCNFQTFLEYERKDRLILSFLIVFGSFCAVGLTINFVNAIVCAIYFAMIWLLSDILFFVIERFRHRFFEEYCAGAFAIFVSFTVLFVGWSLDHHVWRTGYTVETDKNVKDIKIVMFADSHIGSTFQAWEFEKYVNAMQAQNPDMVIVAGDFVDDDTSIQSMIQASKALGKMKTTYGVYMAFGNHDKGYYGPAYRGYSGQDLQNELEKNGVKVLKDKIELADNMFYVIGRQDRFAVNEHGGRRKSMKDLVAPLDKEKYMIVIDHQPSDYDNQAASGVDLVLSGHTHGGQLFPFNYIGKWIGAIDKIYGHEKRGKTDFIVTSGLSDWAIKFKTGCKSEYVVVNLKKRNK